MLDYSMALLVVMALVLRRPKGPKTHSSKRRCLCLKGTTAQSSPFPPCPTICLQEQSITFFGPQIMAQDPKYGHGDACKLTFVFFSFLARPIAALISKATK